MAFDFPGIDKIIGGHESRENLQRVSEYLFQLNEQLKYTLNNIDANNLSNELSDKIENSSEKIGELNRVISDTTRGISSQIKQNADQIALRVTQAAYDGEKPYVGASPPESPEAGRLWLDTSVAPNLLKRYNGSAWETAGTDALKTAGLTIDATGIALAGSTVSISTQTMAIDIVDGDDTSVSKVAIDANGVSAERVNADVLHAGLIYLDNTAPTIPGNRAMRLPPGTYDIPVYPSQPTGYAYWDNGITSIQQALDALPKWLDGAAVNIILHGQANYGTITAQGFYGSGMISIATKADMVSAGYKAGVGAVAIENCTCGITISSVSTTSVTVSNAPRVTVQNSKINISGGNGVTCHQGALVHVSACEINAAHALWADYGGRIFGQVNTGDCTYAAIANYGGDVRITGTRPYGSLWAFYAGSIVDDGTTPTHGSGYVPPPAPTQTTVQIAVSASRSRKGTQWYGDGSDTTVGYGQFESGGQWYGCMTFAGLSALAGKTVLSARLQYTRRNGVGSSGAESITVYSYSAPATLPTGSWATGSPVTLVGSGKATAGVPRGAAAWLDVLASDVQAIIDGTAVGLALYTGNTGYGKGDGAGAANAPILEVTYQ